MKDCKKCIHYDEWDEHCDIYESVPFVKCKDYKEK
jgi:hypothetical protein